MLLHVERTAFIIAADEGMIRSAVRAHFKDAEISNELVTSYFDKLIQVPLQVPRLGTTEVKAYLVLLLTDLARRRKQITDKTMNEAQQKVLELAKKGWSGLSAKDIRAAFGAEVDKVAKEIDLADQLAHILASAEQIAGNRLRRAWLLQVDSKVRVPVWGPSPAMATPKRWGVLPANIRGPAWVVRATLPRACALRPRRRPVWARSCRQHGNDRIPG